VKRGPGSIADILHPVLDTYRDSAVAVVGCHSAGIARESCEIDVLVVSDEWRGPTSIRLGETFCDLSFLSEKESLNPTDPEVAVSLANSKVIRDSGLVLSTSVAANQAVLGANAVRSSQRRLAACLKALSRTDEALLRGAKRDANYWVLSASYEFASSWLYSLEVIPSPSHLLQQLKEHSKGSGRNFEAFSKGAGLEIASRKECGDRLEGLSLLYDLLGSTQAGASAQPSSTEVGFRIVRRKAEQLAYLKEHAESYSYLGGEVVRAVLAVDSSVRPAKGTRGHDTEVLSSLSDEQGGLLSGRLVRELGLERPVPGVEGALELLKDRAAKLARRI
jgi:hypothetical protein